MFKNGLPLIKYRNLEFVNPVNAAQYGLANLQLYWDTGDDFRLSNARNIADFLVKYGSENDDSLAWRYPVLVNGQKDWLSAMAQGQVASLLLRIGCIIGDDYYFTQARKALKPFFLAISQGGVCCRLDEYIWFEEYAVAVPSYTLNGFIVALLGVRDGAIILDDKDLNLLYEEAVDGLTHILVQFDCHGWSRYDLSTKLIGRISINNLASPFYHRFHIELLKVLESLTGISEFRRLRLKWEKSLFKGIRFYTAIAEKIIFRALNPVERAST